MKMLFCWVPRLCCMCFCRTWNIYYTKYYRGSCPKSIYMFVTLRCHRISSSIQEKTFSTVRYTEVSYKLNSVRWKFKTFVSHLTLPENDQLVSLNTENLTRFLILCQNWNEAPRRKNQISKVSYLIKFCS